MVVVGYIMLTLLQTVRKMCQWKVWKSVNNWRRYEL